MKNKQHVHQIKQSLLGWDNHKIQSLAVPDLGKKQHELIMKSYSSSYQPVRFNKIENLGFQKILYPHETDRHSGEEISNRLRGQGLPLAKKIESKCKMCTALSKIV